MKYTAKEDIGDYKKGQEVPAAQAEVWNSMYKEAPCLADGKEVVADEPEELTKEDYDKQTATERARAPKKSKKSNKK